MPEKRDTGDLSLSCSEIHLRVGGWGQQARRPRYHNFGPDTANTVGDREGRPEGRPRFPGGVGRRFRVMGHVFANSPALAARSISRAGAISPRVGLKSVRRLHPYAMETFAARIRHLRSRRIPWAAVKGVGRPPSSPYSNSAIDVVYMGRHVYRVNWGHIARKGRLDFRISP